MPLGPHSPSLLSSSSRSLGRIYFAPFRPFPMHFQTKIPCTLLSPPRAASSLSSSAITFFPSPSSALQATPLQSPVKGEEKGASGVAVTAVGAVDSVVDVVAADLNGAHEHRAEPRPAQLPCKIDPAATAAVATVATALPATRPSPSPTASMPRAPVPESGQYEWCQLGVHGHH